MLVSFTQQLYIHDKSTAVVARSLRVAYRELCVAESSRAFSYIAVFDPTLGRPAIFRQVCLPFGSRSAVNAFIRCARCIQWLACKCLALPTTCYYDDFVVASTPDLANNSERSMSLLLDLLGWKFDKEGPKADSFSNCVTTLGVVIDLANTCRGELRVSNTDKRRTVSIDMIEKVITDKHLDGRSAQVLRGKVDQLLDALMFLKQRLLRNEPRKISMGVGDHLVLLTDASFSDDMSGGLGGVLVDAHANLVGWYRTKIPSQQVRKFMGPDQEVAIAELETLALLVVLFAIWKNDLASVFSD